MGVIEIDGSETWSEASEIEEPVIRQKDENLPIEVRLVIKNVKVASDQTKHGIDLAPYILYLSLQGYHKREVLLPFAVVPHQAEASYYANNQELHMHVPVDRQPWDVEPDPGKEGKAGSYEKWDACFSLERDGLIVNRIQSLAIGSSIEG